MSDLISALQGYTEHCMKTGQEQVADLQMQAIAEIQRLEARVRELEPRYDALVSYARAVELCRREFKDEKVASIFSCACMGPLPECRCAKMFRLVREAIEAKTQAPAATTEELK